MPSNLFESSNDALTAKRPAPKAAELPRRCIATRRREHRNGMIRFVLGPDRQVVPDLAEKLPSRGMWVSADRRALQAAIDKNLFAKAAKGPAIVPDGLLDMLASLARRRCLEQLGQLRGAGQLRVGYFQVREALERGQPAYLVEASDGTENGRAKVIGSAGELPVVGCFSRTDLGEAVGRAAAVHMAVLPGKLGERFHAEALRYAGIMGFNYPLSGGEH